MIKVQPGLAIATFLLALLFDAGANAAPAADGANAAASPRVAEPPPAPAEQPALEMQSLTKMIAGRWSTSISYGRSSAPSSDSHGEQVWRSGPGGFTLMEEERIGTGPGARYLLAIHWWDKDAKELKGLLCNNSGPGACNVDTYSNSSLTWDGKSLSIDLVFASVGKKMHWHELFSDFTPDSFTQTGDMGEYGGPMKRVLTIHATRIDGPQ